MQFFNVEIPDDQIPKDAQYITVNSDGELDAWTARPERDDICWYAERVGPILGYATDTKKWSTHWYRYSEGAWRYEPVELYGRKDDAAKLRYDLLPPKALEQLVAVLTYGAEKYGPNNWRQVAHADDRYYAAALRHIQAWRMGEQLDPESGLPHLAHAMCSLTFLLESDDD